MGESINEQEEEDAREDKDIYCYSVNEQWRLSRAVLCLCYTKKPEPKYLVPNEWDLTCQILFR